MRLREKTVRSHAQFNAAKSKVPGSTSIMTTESMQPQPEQGPAPDNGQVQSRGHRRRRRRRKNKSNQQAGTQPQQMQAAPQSQQEGPPHPAPHNPVHHHQGNKKKKFFQKPSSGQAKPGNSISGGSKAS